MPPQGWGTMPSPDASRRNLQKARAGWRPPQRSEGIKHLVRQWQISTATKESGRALARRLGVSHTYVPQARAEISERTALAA
jgi:hypothetical protein